VALWLLRRHPIKSEVDLSAFFLSFYLEVLRREKRGSWIRVGNGKRESGDILVAIYLLDRKN